MDPNEALGRVAGLRWLPAPRLGAARPQNGPRAVKRIYQQCGVGRDANPGSYPHHPHPHLTKHGRTVWCRGWFPMFTARRDGIRYDDPGQTSASGTPTPGGRIEP